MNKKQLDALFALPNVTGVGTGFKEVNGVVLKQQAVVVLVTKKLPPEQLRQEDLVPKTIDGCQSDVIEVGEIRALVDHDRKALLRPAPPGVSIGHYRGGVGTFGAVVYDRLSGAPLILSNNHVLANSTNGRDWRARIGDPIVQPANGDGNSQTIAKLYKFVALREFPFANKVDCALAEPIDESWVTPDILGIGRVQGTAPAQIGIDVQKSGRSTGVTTGTIKAVNVTLMVSFGLLRKLRFENQILTTNMSAPGDSGSLVLDRQNRAVGLLFAGSDSVTVVNPIEPVLDALNVRF